MKNILYSILITLTITLTFTSNTPAQDYTTISLREGAKARLRKGQIIGNVAYSPNGSKLAVAGSTGVWIYDAQTGEELDLLSGHTRAVRSVSFSPDGSTIASGSYDTTIRLWNVTDGTHIRTLSGHTGLVYSVSFSPDGSTIVSGSRQEIRLWQADTGRHIRTLSGHTWNVYSVSFSPDGSTIASGSYDNTIRLWQADTGTLIRTLSGHTDWVYSVSFSPDGTIIASGSYDNTIRLWQADTGTLIRTLSGHTRAVLSVSFSPDGSTIASGSYDNTIRLWQADTGTHIRTLSGHTRAVLSVSFSPDGTIIASASEDGTILLWDVPSTDEPPPPATDETNNTRADATPLPISGSLTEDIAPGDDVDYFSIQVETAGELTVWTTGALNTVGALEDSDGNTVATNDDYSGYNFSIAHDVEPGTYYVKVESYATATGAYTIFAEFSAAVIDVSTSDAIRTFIGHTSYENRAPVFTESTSTTRSIAENRAAGENIGEPVAATDTDDDPLTYSIGGADASSFTIDTATGQLKTKALLDYETKNSYSVMITVSDGSLTDTINVTINVTDVDESPTNNAPEFTEGENTTRSVTENTGTGVDIGAAVSATDADGHTLTYTLGGTDKGSFSIDSTTGQLRTDASLDYETKSLYSVAITVSDGNGGSDSITVTINVSDVDETPANSSPEFTGGSSTTLTVAENTSSGVNIGDAFAATDADNDELAYSLSGTDASSFSFNSNSGQLKTSATLDYESKSSYSVSVTASDGTDTDSISVTINVTDVNEAPAFSDGDSTTRSIAENVAADINIGSAVSASDPDGDDLTYTLGGTDAASFSIDGETGQLKTKSTLDYEKMTAYSVTISVSDGSLTDIITITISVTNLDESTSNNPPVFSDGTSTTRSVAENTDAGSNIGTRIGATDVDKNTLAYLLSGTDAASFSIDSANGQLKTSAALNHEAKSSYKVTVTVSDGNGTDSIAVTINVADVNEAPVIAADAKTTLSIAENTTAGVTIGGVLSATDPDDGDTLTYSLGGTDASSFDIVSTSGQLQTKAALNYESKTSYSVKITVSDNTLADTIDITINITDVDENRAPVFTDGDSTTREVEENTASGVNIGSAIGATDADDDDLTYSLGGTDAAAFRIDSSSGQLRTKAALDYEIKDSYSVTITVSDGTLTDDIDITINVTDVDENRAPVFTDGDSTTRSVAENTGSGVNIGSAIGATDADDDDLTYSLGGTDTASFGIDSSSGQLRTKAALDYETKDSYSVTITVSDGTLTDEIDITINVTDVDENRAPVFADGDSTTRSVAENTGSGVNIGSAIGATDADDDDLTYSLGGTDADSFSINTTNGQLLTRSALNYETKTSYSLTITVSDGNGGRDSIKVTISVTDVDENRAPEFTDGDSTTRSITEDTEADMDIGNPVVATDADDDTLTYSLGGTDAAAFKIVSTSGQLQTKAPLNSEQQDTYFVTVTVSDGNGGSNSIVVTISIIGSISSQQQQVVNSAPMFTDGDSTTRSVAENTESGQNIGDPVAATDADNDTLTYTLSGTDATSFSIVNTNGQLQTNAALDYETKTSYTVTISVSDENGGSDSITVTISVTDVTEITITPVSERTPQIRDEIVTTAGVDSAEDVTPEHLAAITSLDLQSKGITSLKTGDFDGLISLKWLSFRFNNLTDISPLANLTQLTNLSLYHINIMDISPLENLTELQSLDLANNKIVDISALDDLTKLTFLKLNRNRISDISALDDLTKLSHLNLSNNNKISDISALDDMTALTFLEIANNNISDISPLTNMTALTSLSLDENSISNISPLTNMTALTLLSLGENSINDISSLTNITGLRFLILDHNSISDISALDDMTALTSLNLSNNSISDVSALDDMTALTSLNLSNNSISGISALDDMTALTSLNLSNNSISGISALDDMTALKSLYLANNNISDISYLEGFTMLKYLTLHGNPITDFGSIATILDKDTGITIASYIGNRYPWFIDGNSTTRSVAENTEPGQNIDRRISAKDPDGDAFSYYLRGTDAASFSIVSTTGQLQTKENLDYETKSSYSVTVYVIDVKTKNDKISVTINVTDVEGAAPSAQPSPDTTALLSNYPNPFNPETWIPYQLANASDVQITIYDARGVIVRRLELGHQRAGYYITQSSAAHWDGRNNLGERVANGIYFFQLQADSVSFLRKMVILK